MSLLFRLCLFFGLMYYFPWVFFTLAITTYILISIVQHSEYTKFKKRKFYEQEDK